jgi:FAD/FMN-containing dehydrogenase
VVKQPDSSFCFLVNDDLRDELKAVSTQITTVALELDGTCTGEHGVGLGKRAALRVRLD